MREIKFRAWDSISKSFVTDFIIDRLGNEYQTNKCEFWGDDRKITLMQFTGLKDKNGVEIYEGDIAKYNGWIVDVRWNGKLAYYYVEFLKEQFKDNYRVPLYECKDLEVIGNIHEHPQLLQFQSPKERPNL